MADQTSIGVPEKMALWKFAADYKIYSVHASLGHKSYLDSVFSPSQQRAFDEISKNPQAQKWMTELSKEQAAFYEHPHLLSPNQTASKSPPWEHSIKALQNMESGTAGLIFQKVGEAMYPNDPGKAAQLGAIGKTLGEVGSKAAEMKTSKAAAKDVGKPWVPEQAPANAPTGKAGAESKATELQNLLKYIDDQSLTGALSGAKAVPQDKATATKPDSSSKTSDANKPDIHMPDGPAH